MSDLPYEVMSDEELISEFHKAGIYTEEERQAQERARESAEVMRRMLMNDIKQQGAYQSQMIEGAYQSQMIALSQATMYQVREMQQRNIHPPYFGLLGGALGGLLR